MGRWAIAALVLLLFTSFVSYATGQEPPVPQEATGNWSAPSDHVDTSSGAAVTSYPFELPPARGSVQPSLGLTYRHTAGPSVVGEGWSLGLPEIVLRGVAGGPPRFDASDHYELSGQELVECPAGGCDGQLPNWASSGWQQYRGKAERSPVRAYRRTIVPVGYTWRLALPQGGFAELGFAKVMPSAGVSVDRTRTPSGGDAIYRWNLVRLVDAGPVNTWPNVTVFVWKHMDTVTYDVSVLTDIFYTPEPGNVAALDRYAHHVRLTYEEWHRTLSIATPPMWNRIADRRLSTVSIASRGIDPNAPRERVRVYRLGYRAEPIRQHSFLESVAVEGRCAAPIVERQDDAGFALPEVSCPGPLPATTFEYTPEQGRINPATGGYDGIRETSIRFVDENDQPVASPAFEWEAIRNGKLALVDVNQDGLPDLFAFRGGAPLQDGGAPDGYVFLNPGSSSAGARNFQRASAVGSAGSLGSDRLTVFGSWSVGGGQWSPGSASTSFLFRPAQSDPSRFPALLRRIVRDGSSSGWIVSETAIPTSPSPSYPHVFGDFDGDGSLDALYVDPGANATSDSDDSVRLALSKRSEMRFAPGSATGLFLRKDRGGPPYWTLADMNGDGLLDYVTLQAPEMGTSPFVYIPRNGAAEAKSSTNQKTLFGCDANAVDCVDATASPGFNPYTSASLKEVLIEGGVPWTGEHVEEKLYFHDVTGDGFADILLVRDDADRVDVTLWVNLDGKHFANGDTHPVYKQNAPVSGPQALFADMNGNGVEDLVLVGNDAALVLDFQWNERPGLLTSIHHSSGATTSFSYELLSDHEKNASSDRWTTELGPWKSHSPAPTHVVTRVSTSSGAPAPYDYSSTVSYRYRDPVFDRWRGRLAGFRRTRAIRGPLATETRYLFGACFPEDGVDVDPSSCPSQEDDQELVLAGLPFVVEQRSEVGEFYASTTVYSYAVSLLGTPSGVNVNMVHTEAVNTFLYDLSNYAPQSLTVPLIVSTRRGADPVTEDVPIRATGVRLRSRQTIDEGWRQLAAWDDGHVDLLTGAAIDRPIKRTTTWHPQTSFDERIDRPASVSIAYDGLGMQTPLVPDGPLRQIRYEYDSLGRVLRGKADISGALALQRFHESGLAIAQEPDSPNGTNVTLFTVGYDAYGQPTTRHGAVSECSVTEYAAPYFDLPQAIYEGTDATCSTTSAATLRTRVSFDRGLGAMTSRTTPSGTETRIERDPYGRVTRVLETPGGGGSPVPQVQLTYVDVATYTDEFSRVHKTRVERLDASGGVNRTTWHHVSSLGMPIVTYSQADASSGDAAPWIAHRGPLLVNSFGVPYTTFRAEFVSAPTDSVPFAWTDRSYTYDLLARPTHARDLDLNVVAQRIYRPLSVDVLDAESVENQGSRPGQFVTVDTDGHGRTVRTLQRRGAQYGGPLETRVEHLATGEVSGVQQAFTDAAAIERSVLRWFRFDSLGRVVENAEPNTAKDFAPDPNSSASMKAWRYAYDRSGRLVGTRDARGCGKNLRYDAAGRLLGEDYSPCLASQAPYSAPDWATGYGTEAFYRYDTPESGQSTDCSPSWLCMRGKLSSVRDRGAHTRFAYDARGRQTRVERRIAKPGRPSTDLTARYSAHWFRAATEYDEFDRVTRATTGAESPELLEAGASAITFGYSVRDLPTSVGGTYGTLASQYLFDADGFEKQVVYADGVATARRTPDALRRLRRYELSRAVPSAWSNPAYTPPADANERMMAQQLVLADSTFARDLVGNVISEVDARDPERWVEGAKPRSTTMGYDDANRLAWVQHATGVDYQVSPFAPEEASGDARPLPRSFTWHRMVGQEFDYDALGSLRRTTDNAWQTFDRSLGDVSLGYSVNKPAQLLFSSGLAAGTGLDAYYDDAGNLVGLDVERSGSCSAPTNKCAQRFLYDWDEVGQLVRARRWDYPTLVANPVYPSVPPTSPAAEIEYQYSQGQRVVRYAHDPSATPRYTVDVFGTLRLTNAEFDATASAYEQTADTEQLFVGGVAHVVHAPGLPNVGSDRHVFLTVGDRLGSPSVILDKDTAELVEHVTYQSYGAVESDYRTARWGAFREDLRFTGKEDEIELGLQYFGARYYSPHLGRFISPDPLTIHGAGGDPNPYAYVRGRVYNLVDPLGLDGSGCLGAERCDPPVGIDLGGAVGAIGDALSGLFGGGGGGGGSSNASRGPASGLPPSAAPLLARFPRQAVVAYGVWSSASLATSSWAFRQTGVGSLAEAIANPVQDGTEYLAGMGEGVLTGTLGPFAHAGSALGYGPRQVLLVGDTPDAHRGFGDGMGIVGAAFGVAEVTGALEQLGAGLTTAAEGLGAGAGPRAYSVAFETRLSPGSLVGSRGAHFAEANEALFKAMQESSEVASSMRQLGIEMASGARGAFPRTPPPGWTWHHELEPGLMRLVPRTQHTLGSPWWYVLHPGGEGGYSIWGRP